MSLESVERTTLKFSASSNMASSLISMLTQLSVFAVVSSVTINTSATWKSSPSVAGQTNVNKNFEVIVSVYLIVPSCIISMY